MYGSTYFLRFGPAAKPDRTLVTRLAVLLGLPFQRALAMLTVV